MLTIVILTITTSAIFGFIYADSNYLAVPPSVVNNITKLNKSN